MLAARLPVDSAIGKPRRRGTDQQMAAALELHEVRGLRDFDEHALRRIREFLLLAATTTPVARRSRLRCRQIVGEGGNLGFSQLGRVEYALAGGRLNTDFIDNSGGVNCSDLEVNIKILLELAANRRNLKRKARDHLLARMTDEVASLVLRNNYLQAQALSALEARAAIVVGDGGAGTAERIDALVIADLSQGVPEAVGMAPTDCMVKRFDCESHAPCCQIMALSWSVMRVRWKVPPAAGGAPANYNARHVRIRVEAGGANHFPGRKT